MNLYWNGVDITGKVNITGCNYRDACGERADCLTLEMENAADWYRWSPEEGDEIDVWRGNNHTGKLVLSAVLPRDGRYRVFASGLKGDMGRRKWQSYENLSFAALYEQCAAECGMKAALHGTDGKDKIRYVIRQMESGAAFLARIGAWEGLQLKCRGGIMHGIDILSAQERDAITGLRIGAEDRGTWYTKSETGKLSRLTVMTPWAQATARDTDAAGNGSLTVTDIPAENSAQAGKWARGLLLKHNRLHENLEIDTALDMRIGAMEKIEVTGGTAMDGEWMVEEAEHDLFNERTYARMRRCVRSIA